MRVVDSEDDGRLQRLESFEGCRDGVVSGKRTIENGCDITEAGATESTSELGDELRRRACAEARANVDTHRFAVPRELHGQDRLSVASGRFDNAHHTAGKPLDQPRPVYESRKQSIAPTNIHVPAANDRTRHGEALLKAAKR
jgi:hypothetical protein